MKREAFNHPKMLDLATRLGVKKTTARGIVATLWNWAADTAPQGNIGKWSDAVIAAELEYEGDPETLIDALVESRWVDRCAVHRLVIHDLEEHAPQWLKTKLTRTKKSFITATPITQVPSQSAPTNTPKSAPLCSAPLCSSNQTTSNPTSDSPAANGRVFEDSVLTEEHLASPRKLRKWFDHDSKRPDRIVDGSEATWRLLAAVVVKVNMTPGVRDRIAVLKWLVIHKRWNYVPAMYDDIAAEILREEEARAGPSPFAVELVEKLPKVPA